MKYIPIVLALTFFVGFNSTAEFIRVADGGIAVTLSDLLPESESAVMVFHAPWSQDCIELIKELEQWTVNHPSLKIILVDVVDERTRVYQQFHLKKIPTMLIFDENKEQVGGALYDVDSLENALVEAGVI